MTIRAFIAGCSGQVLTPDERAFFRDAEPGGFILFKRNIGTRSQVLALTQELREAVGRAAYGRAPEPGGVLGGAAAEGLSAGGVLPVIKPIPGHGRAGADSRHDLP